MAEITIDPNKPVEIKPPDYSDEEKAYFTRVTTRIVEARNELSLSHDEFDGMTYLQYCETNRKLANTYVEPKKTKSDNNFSSGTVRQKMFAYLAAISGMDLSVDVETFDEQNHEIKELGEAMEDIIFEVGERDGEGGDTEKKLFRQYTMFEQGTVFVRETFAKRWKLKKILSGVFNGKIKSVKWAKRLIESYQGCTRQILLNENIIPGNIRQYEMALQPFFVDIEIMPYEEAKQIYQKWERWENVPKEMSHVLGMSREDGLKYSSFKLYANKKNMVEIARYQDAINNEMMIFINGVMMMPIEYPMLTDTYDIAKQVCEIISPNFFFGKSMPMRLRNNTLLYDEMIRMALKKTQKSFAPPILNLSGRQLSQRIFAPGAITSGIKENSIALLDPNAQPINQGEVGMIQMLQDRIDEKSVNPVFAGQQPSGSATATQILEVQKQAKMMIGLTVLVCQLLEYKLGWLRLHNILRNYFKPQKRVYNRYDEDFMNKYRSVTRDKYIPGIGKGKHIIKVTDKIPDIEEQQEETNVLSTVESPVKVTYVDPAYITSSKLIWMISVVPKERKSDALSKVLFNEFMTGAMQFPNVNTQYLSERYAEIWDENPGKIFPVNETPPEEGATPPADTAGPAAGVPNLPTPQNSKSKLLEVAANGGG